jgi:hypothetical protein
MFMTPVIGIIFILMLLVMGCIIGFVVVVLIYRSRITGGVVARGTIFAGLTFLFLALLCGWAGLHAAFYNGRRLPVGPSGEDLRFRNFLADHESVLCLGGSIAASLLACYPFRRRS